MKTKYVVLASSLMGVVAYPALCALDLIEVPRNPNQLLSLNLPLAELRSGSNAPQLQVISLSLDLAPARTRTNLWFSPPSAALFSPGVEWAERINAQAVRRQREAWENAQKTGQLLPIPSEGKLRRFIDWHR